MIVIVIRIVWRIVEYWIHDRGGSYKWHGASDESNDYHTPMAGTNYQIPEVQVPLRWIFGISDSDW